MNCAATGGRWRRRHGRRRAIVFDVRLGLERLSRLAGRLTKEQIKTLEAHVDQEERARGNNEPLSIRLATEFHILLAEVTILLVNPMAALALTVAGRGYVLGSGRIVRDDAAGVPADCAPRAGLKILDYLT